MKVFLQEKYLYLDYFFAEFLSVIINFRSATLSRDNYNRKKKLVYITV